MKAPTYIFTYLCVFLLRVLYDELFVSCCIPESPLGVGDIRDYTLLKDRAWAMGAPLNVCMVEPRAVCVYAYRSVCVVCFGSGETATWWYMLCVSYLWFCAGLFHCCYNSYGSVKDSVAVRVDVDAGVLVGRGA